MLKSRDHFIDCNFNKHITLKKNQFVSKLYCYNYYKNHCKIFPFKEKRKLANVQLKQLNFDLLIIFYTVATLGSFSGAAKRLCLSQPSISIALRKIEKEIGFVVFKQAQNKKAFLLTPGGLILFNYVQRFFQIIDESREVSNLNISHDNFKTFNTLFITNKNKSLSSFIKPMLTNFFFKKKFFETAKINANFYENTSKFFILKTKDNIFYNFDSSKNMIANCFIKEKSFLFKNFKKTSYNPLRLNNFIEIHTIHALLLSFDMKISNCIYWGS